MVPPQATPAQRPPGCGSTTVNNPDTHHVVALTSRNAASSITEADRRELGGPTRRGSPTLRYRSVGRWASRPPGPHARSGTRPGIGRGCTGRPLVGGSSSPAALPLTIASRVRPRSHAVGLLCRQPEGTDLSKHRVAPTSPLLLRLAGRCCRSTMGHAASGSRCIDFCSSWRIQQPGARDEDALLSASDRRRA